MTNTISSGAPTPVAPAPSVRNISRLGNLSVAQKLALGSVALLIPFGISLGFNINDQVQELRKDRLAERSVDYLLPARDLLTNVQLNRRSANLYLSGTPLAQTSLNAEREAIEQSLAQLKELDRTAPIGETTTKAIATFEQSWNQLSGDIGAKRLTPQQSFTRIQNLLTNEMTALFNAVAIDGQLRYLQYPTTPELASLATDVMPRHWADTGRIRTLAIASVGTAAANNGRVPAGLLPQYQDALQVATQAQSAINQTAQDAFATNPRDTAQLKAAYDEMRRQYAQIQDAFQTVATTGRPPADVAAVTNLASASLEAQSKFYDETVSALKQAIRYEIDALNFTYLMTFVASAALLLVALWLFTLIARAITQPLGLLTNASRRLAAGDLEVQVPVTTRDEIGALTSSFNTAATQLRQNAEHDALERLEAQRLQQNVGEFLDVTMDIAEGDLTKRGKVTEDVLGNVVDSINLMTEELGDTLKQVQNASVSVGNGSQQMRGATEQVEHGVRLTAVEAQQVARRVEEITATIREMAERAQQSADTARQALQVSQEGQEAVQATLDGMQNIRREVQQVAQRIRALGERSLEIQEIVDTISQIARRTNLLALNASVEAAGAGEAGGRFSAVAEEIRELANTSAQATSRVANLIRNVQIEVQDVTLGTEESAREVEQGYRVAGTAGQRLREIGELAEQSAQLAEDVAASTQEQVSGVEQVSANVQQIATIAQSSEASVRQGRLVAEELEELARQLNAALARFRLPA